MKKSKFSENQIIKALKENEQGRTVSEISKELGIEKSTFITGAKNTEAWR